jgi:hypothetical protein
MAKKMKKIPRKEKKAESRLNQNEAWISMPTGLRIITLVSVGMMVLTAWMTIPALGWFEGLLWTLGFGVAIWLVFIGFLYFNRFVRGKRE